MPARRRDPVSVPRTFHSSGRHHHDYGIDESISRAGLFSNAVLDDTDYAAARSRGKDYDLLRNTNNAIIATETHSSPRAAVASMKARASSVPPKVQARPMRLQQQLNSRPKVVGSPQVAPTIVFVSVPPLASNPARIPSKPVVHSEVPWRMRASSVPPADIRGSLSPRSRSYHPDLYEPIISPPLGTEGLRAHRTPSVLRSRAGSVPPPQRPRSFYPVESQPIRSMRAGSVEPMRPRSYYAGQSQPCGTEGLRAHRAPPVSRLSRAQSLSREQALNRLRRNPFDFEIEELEKKRNNDDMSIPIPRGNPGRAKRPATRVWPSQRAASEPPAFIPPSASYPRVGDVRTLGRQLYTRRGQVGPMVPNNHVVGNIPLVYMPPRGPRPSIRAKSAIYNIEPYHSAGLQSSRPPLPKQSDRKAIRTVDGFSKPKNVMSWEYRVESRVSPDDLIYQPARLGRMRDQVRGAQELMDKHRQLLDRYLDTDRKTTYSSSNNSPTSSAGGDPNNAPMSDLRRRLRRTLAKTKNNP